MIAALPLVTSALSLLTSPDAGSATAAAKSAATGGDFSSVMAKMASEATNSVKHAESLSVDGLQGKANVQAVVEAVMSAQENLQAALALRDKAVTAFNEVSRMAI